MQIEGRVLRGLDVFKLIISRSEKPLRPSASLRVKINEVYFCTPHNNFFSRYYLASADFL